ncbi:MAG: DUF4445 domain-containing protein [Alphaproteobacteria bacterium]|nr:DUF4445 domain-containing protein [Alphaproteobacteria bacterium]
MDQAAPAAPAATEAKDALVLFMPSGRRGRFPLGTPLLDAARALGVYVESVCGGRGLCGRCQVEIAEGAFAKHGITSRAANLSPAEETEAPYRRRGVLPPARRLSCAGRVLGDLVIDVPGEVAVNRQIVRKRAETRTIAADPATRLVTVSVKPPDMEHPLGDADRLVAAIEATGEWRGVWLDPPLLTEVQRVLRAGDWTVTAAVHQDIARPQVIALWPGQHTALFGVAFDIGSTTIAGHLVDLASGRTVASAGTTNPQIRFGEDLMSRISYLMLNPDDRGALTEAVRGAIGALITRLCAQADIPPEEVLEAVFVGNPVMHHLFLGIDPQELGQAPFALAVSGALRLAARELGIAIHPGGRAYILPCIAGHVGADAAAVALAEGPQHHAEITLVVDVGTNAEILLGNRDRVLAASSPTGPAFEGAQITAGQRAAPGAIERVRIDPATLEPRFKVIGADAWSDDPGFGAGIETVGVTGICGSGIIEVVAEMFLAGIIGADGLIDAGLAARSPRIETDGRTARYRLWDGAVPVAVTQTDIRAIQLAKGALYAGARLLMDRLGVERVERIKLAGAFGSYIDPKYAMVLGLIPDCRLDRVSAIGNAAGTGARMALVSRAHRAEVEALVRRVEKIETALESRFQEHFVHAMALPNGRDPFPELAAAVTLPERRETEGRRRPGRRRGG